MKESGSAARPSCPSTRGASRCCRSKGKLPSCWYEEGEARQEWPFIIEWCVITRPEHAGVATAENLQADGATVGDSRLRQIRYRCIAWRDVNEDVKIEKTSAHSSLSNLKSAGRRPRKARSRFNNAS